MAYREAQEICQTKPWPITDRQAGWILGLYMGACVLLPIGGLVVGIAQGIGNSTQATPDQVR